MHKILLFFILAFYIPSFGQQISIPYRDGSKWGISDREGKIIIAPKFDSISLGNKYMNKPGHLISWSNGKQGLIIAGREMLPPEYDFVVTTDEYIKAEKTTSESILSYLFDNNGTPIYPGGIINIGLLTDEHFYDKQGSFRILLLQVTGANNLESIFTWNLRDKAVLQWLAKDVYSAVLEDVKGQSYAMMRIREKENSPVKISRVWFGEDGRLTLADGKRDIPVDKERDRDVVMPYERGLDGDINIESPVGDLDRGVEVPEPSGSYGGIGSGTGSRSGNGGGSGTVTNAPAKLVSTYKNYKKQPDGTLGMEQRDGSGKTWKSKIKFKPDAFTVKSFSSNKRVGDTMYYYNNYVLYTYKGRSGILKDGQTGRSIEYDELSDIYYTAQKSRKNQIAFIAGSRNKRSKAIKYGLIDMEGKEIIPFVYDELKAANTSASPGYDLLAKRDGKYEIITAEGDKVAGQIDEVASRKQESKPYLEIKAGGKYGFFTRINGEYQYLIPPVFPYPIKVIYMAYPGQSLWISRPDSSDRFMVLVELMDAGGNTKGFARKDGFLYFKD